MTSAREVLQIPLLRQFGVYTASNILSRAAPFVLLPILTRYLTPAEYGTIAMFLLVAAFVEPFIGLGFHGSVAVRFFDKVVDMPTLIGSGLVMISAAAAVALVLIVVALGSLQAFTQVPGLWLLAVVPVALGRSMVNAYTALLRVREAALRFAVLQNVQSVLLVTLSIAFVVVAGLSWQGRVLSEVAATVVIAGTVLVLLYRGGDLRLTVDRAYVRGLLRFGVPLIPHLIGSLLIVQTDRLLLTNMVGLAETGLYTVAFQLAVVIEIVAVSFNNAYSPWLFKRLQATDADLDRRLVRLTYVQFGAMAALAGFVALVMPWIATTFLGGEYAASTQFIGWLSLGLLFSGMYYMVANYIFFKSKTEWLALVTFATGLVNIPLTYALITLNGAIGAAQASALAYALAFVLTWVLSNRVHPLPWLGALRQAPG